MNLVRIEVYLLLLTIDLVCARICYQCRHSLNEGCDIDMDKALTGGNQISCTNDCWAQVIQSGAGDSAVYEVVRDCSYYAACTDASYTSDGQTLISRCCKDDLCNESLGDEIFQCFECEAADGPGSECPADGFMASRDSSRHNGFCATYCEKTLTTTNGTTRVRRSCRNDCKDMEYTAFGVHTKTECCKGDICNGQERLKTFWVVCFVFLGIAGLVC